MDPFVESSSMQKQKTELESAKESAGTGNTDLFNMLNSSISNTMQNPATSTSNHSLSISMNEQSASTATPVIQQTQPQKDDDFEELSESREIIEDRIFRLKLQMIDLTIKQQELTSKKETLATDKVLLEKQEEETKEEEARCAEQEAYDEAEKLSLRLQSIK